MLCVTYKTHLLHIQTNKNFLYTATASKNSLLKSRGMSPGCPQGRRQSWCHLQPQGSHGCSHQVGSPVLMFLVPTSRKGCCYRRLCQKALISPALDVSGSGSPRSGGTGQPLKSGSTRGPSELHWNGNSPTGSLNAGQVAICY